MTDTPPTTEPVAAPYDALGEAKHLLRTRRAGTLATLDDRGGPFASLVSVATAPDGRPLLLLSRLAAHTAHLEADPRCSLLLAQTGKGDPLAHPRLTLVGQASRLEDDARGSARSRFLARNPKSALYADFPDFSFWAMAIDAAHLNGGFGRAARFNGAELLTPVSGLDGMLATEARAVAHMNHDHTDALAHYATVLAGAEPGEWRASGLDPEGLDLICGDRVARVLFAKPVTEEEGYRNALVALLEQAKRKSATQ